MKRRKIPINPSSIKLRIKDKISTYHNKKDRVFIIAGGPSVLSIDLNLLKNEDVICINKSIDLIDNPKYFITMDYSFFSKTGKSTNEIKKKVEEPIFIVNTKENYIKKIDDVYTDTRMNLRYVGLENYTIIESKRVIDEITGFGKNFNEFCHGNNSGYCAIQFAILKGYKEIYLIGFDLDETNSNTHFHNAYNTDSNYKFKKNLQGYKSNLLDSLQKINDVKISTLTKSPLDKYITNISIQKLLMKRDFIIVAYYTIDTPYENEAKKLIESINKLKLDYDVIGVSNFGNWQANTRFKAKFMEDMLNKHVGKNLLYVDSDAIIHSRPILFENYEADIAVRWQDFRWRKNECLSGTIFMANNEKTRELCRRWQDINTSEGPNATTFEQWNLGSVIKEMEAEGKIKTDNLPPEYTMIFDSMRAMYPDIVPVIEHFQASRRLRSKI